MATSIKASLIVMLTLLCGLNTTVAHAQRDFKLSLRHRIEIESDGGHFHAIERSETWPADQTAIIVCDMWDLHHCHNAFVRVGQLAPRMNEVLKFARDQGATIVHAPSSCMDFYADHPARKRAQSVALAASVPEGIEQWCNQIPAEERGKYPIDQSDGGEDDDPEIHKKWAEELTAKGLNPRAPWTRQTSDLTIDEQVDYISDSGPQIWSILEKHQIQNVILVGVHTNMCVLGRPFGLRQMAKNGKNVVLMRDMTDTMYNPAAWPYVSHFSGTDLIVEHIEKFVCPTITSDQLIGGLAFRFPGDDRKHVAIVIAEDEYETETTLPAWASEHLQKDFRITLIFGSKTERNDLPGLSAIAEADLLMLSVRRRTLPPEQLQQIRDFEASAKPMIGIRTASHAFCLRQDNPSEGLADWPEFDAEVWGGSYSGHTKNGVQYSLASVASMAEHPVLAGVDLVSLKGHKSLYNVSPLMTSTQPLIDGTLDSEADVREPVAWLNTRKNGGRSFYTSLGHVEDFKQLAFQRLLANSVRFLIEQTAHAK